MRFGSLFTGIGGFDLGLERAGHEVAFQCEADLYRRRVLARHWPGVPCYEDVRMVARGENGDQASNGRHRHLDGTGHDECADSRAAERHCGTHAVDLIAGGFPCQDLSVAGRRAGLDGERSGLFFEFARVADAVLPDGGWFLIENVPGLLSSNGGRDFAVLLATLAEFGFHDLAWRVLDSRYLGVPQRRRRVFILGRRSRGRSASEVLLEPESGGGDFEAGSEAGPRVAASLSRGSSGAGVSAPRRRQEDDENIIAGQLTRRTGKGINTTLDDGALIAHTLTAPRIDAPTRDGKRQDGSRTDRIPIIARTSGDGAPLDPDRVRAPTELPRPMDGDPNPRPDGPRYAACGDAVTVNVAHWVGTRLLSYEQAVNEQAA